jgi:hypothetical protein
MERHNDGLTALSIGAIAIALVTADHEAFGHGGACLALGGHIEVLTSSIFHCDLRSDWIAGAGPLGNIVGGTIAALLARVVPARFVALKLLLIAVAAMSFFWEGAYLAYAMLKQSGDLYFFATFLLGPPALWQRLLFAGAGIVVYVLAIRLTSRALLSLWPDAKAARSVARSVWLGVTAAAVIAALLYRGHGWGDLHDAVLESSVASLPLLFIPRGASRGEAGVVLARNWIVIAAAIVIVAIFAATLGHGVGAGVVR